MGAKQPRLGKAEARELLQTTQFSNKELNSWYKGFLRECPSGALNEEEFCRIYKQFFPFGDATQLASLIFATFSTNSDGMVEFSEFVNIFSVTSRGSMDDRLDWCFKLYDQDKDGFITRQDMIPVIDAIHKMSGGMVEYSEDDLVPQKRVKQIFEEMDKDEDGRLSKEEFIAGAKSDPSILKSLSVFEELL